jgi:acyl carrier protein
VSISSQIEETVIAAIRELGEVTGEVSRDTRLDTIDIDSLDLVEIAQLMEDEYGIEIRGEDVKRLKTVGDVVDLAATRAG